MIDYALLCQAIGDWRSGRRPTLPPSSTPTVPARSESTGMEEVDSDLLVVDEYGESAVPQGYQSPEHTPVAGIEYDAAQSYGADGYGGEPEVEVESEPRENE
jgi:hypothetical protein